MSKLKPCPWCHRKPVLDGRRLTHISKLCIIGDLDIIFQNEQQAVQSWNDHTNPGVSRQPTPKGEGPEIGTLVIADIEGRIRKGVDTYGEPLKAHNGRDSLVDAYQEALDLAIYLRQAIEERR